MRATIAVIFALALAAAALGPAPGAGAACTALGGSVLCGDRLSNVTVGRTVVFPRGPAGERTGGLVAPGPGRLPGPVIGAAPAAPRPLDRPGRLSDPRRGADFGAFEFRSPAPGGLNRTGP